MVAIHPEGIARFDLPRVAVASHLCMPAQAEEQFMTRVSVSREAVSGDGTAMSRADDTPECTACRVIWRVLEDETVAFVGVGASHRRVHHERILQSLQPESPWTCGLSRTRVTTLPLHHAARPCSNPSAPSSRRRYRHGGTGRPQSLAASVVCV